MVLCASVLQLDHIRCVLALLMIGYGSILDRLVISHLILAGSLKMNHQRLLFTETDLNQNFFSHILYIKQSWMYHLIRKVRATTLLLHTRYKWFRPLCTASIFRKIHQFWPDCFDAFLGKEKSFHNHVCSCFRYDSGEDGLVPLYLVTQKVPEMKILGQVQFDMGCNL